MVKRACILLANENLVLLFPLLSNSFNMLKRGLIDKINAENF